MRLRTNSACTWLPMLLCVRCFFSSSFVARLNPVACHLFHSALPLRGVRRVFIQGSPLIKSQSNDGYHRYIHTYVSVLNTVRVFYYTIFNLIVNLYRRIAARYPHHWREQKRNKHIFTYCWNKCTQVSSMCWATCAYWVWLRHCWIEGAANHCAK